MSRVQLEMRKKWQQESPKMIHCWDWRSWKHAVTVKKLEISKQWGFPPLSGEFLQCFQKKRISTLDLRIQPLQVFKIKALIWLILWSLFEKSLFLGPTVTYVACSKTMSPQMSQKATPPLRHRTCERTPRRNHRPSDSDTTHDTHVWNYEPPLYLDWWNTIYICICLGRC